MHVFLKETLGQEQKRKQIGEDEKNKSEIRIADFEQ